MKKKRSKTPLIFAALILVLAGALYISNFSLTVSHFSIISNKLPNSFDGFKIAQISDLHGAEFGHGNEKLLNLLKNESPNIIAVTGDIADSEKTEEIAIELCAAMCEIAPVYFVAGNHEWALDNPRGFFSRLEDVGVKVLENEYEVFEINGEQLVLAGVGDPNGPYDQISPTEFMATLPEGYHVILYHRNDNLELFASIGADLVLSGHAHGGLIRLPLVGGLIGTNRDWFPDYTSGIYESGETKMVVSRGLGNVGKTFRLFNSPQLVIVTLGKE